MRAFFSFFSIKSIEKYLCSVYNRKVCKKNSTYYAGGRKMFNWILDEAAQAQGGSLMSMGITIAALIAVFYFMMYRPQKKQEKETRNLLDSLQVGDEITTHSGIIGKIVSMKEETVTIETSKDKTKIRFLKTAIARVDVRAEDC